MNCRKKHLPNTITDGLPNAWFCYISNLMPYTHIIYVLPKSILFVFRYLINIFLFSKNLKDL